MKEEGKSFQEFKEEYAEIIRKAEKQGINQTGLGFIGNLMAALEGHLTEEEIKELIEACLINLEDL